MAKSGGSTGKWRRIDGRSPGAASGKECERRTTLPSLHREFQAALGWTNSHLHEFIINSERCAEPDLERTDELKQRNERRVRRRLRSGAV
jgi:hypothetical protein